ncbi:DUF2268 domain-containing protein [Catenulispora pinisilvae]|uniref:DUF2268 domain-containing protein n=1 Tax=Catenulispora pinisilvae TaxID=2705253 RepID=UPI0018915C9D|nr:DUF2268 domain-containing putative Zn-dependent protease [Catenulispora pinisilvae]
MKIVVHDTATATAELLRRPPAERPDLLREIYAPLQTMLALTGGGDIVRQHELLGSGFRLDRDDERYLPALQRMRDADVWSHLRDWLTKAWRHLDAAVPGVGHADTVHVVLLLGNPDDDHLVKRSAGYFGFGGIPGSILLTMWPTDAALRNIGFAAVHELHHNVRYANVRWNPTTVTLGEQIVAEGLAEAFVRELGGEDAMGPWTKALEGEQLQHAYDKITAAIDTTGMQNLPGYVLGDATARRMGLPTTGLPDFAGYGVGLRIADAHLAASGLTAAASVALPARAVLGNAGVATAAQ